MGYGKHFSGPRGFLEVFAYSHGPDGRHYVVASVAPSVWSRTTADEAMELARSVLTAIAKTVGATPEIKAGAVIDLSLRYYQTLLEIPTDKELGQIIDQTLKHFGWNA